MVLQRTREIGIRVALGAQRRDIMRMVLRQGIRATVAGVTIGVVAGLALTRLLRGLLYGVTPGDWLTFLSVALLLLVVALAACSIPARRATRVDPIVALRYE
jgi:putative ABC transport system permease protein